ncbi:MAG: chlorite dismutase family protein [Chloroflexi bacterium]|nr:chlorite dismutase family protein [Chloroflexota bacterium]MDA1147275.1 chlorite dismutase family protein [Chloroflexota bacterium]
MTQRPPASVNGSSGHAGGPPAWVTAAANAPRRPQSPHGKQFVKFSFFKIRDDVRALKRKKRQALGDQLSQLLVSSNERMLTRVYSTLGSRGDTDFLIWQVADNLDVIMDWQAELLDTKLGWALERPHSFLSMTMRSQYQNQYTPGAEHRDRFRADGGTNDWLFVYPMAKTKDWYQSSATRRNKAMAEHIAVGHAYPEIKINTTYSYGLDDQEFVVAFEGDSPGQFLALVKDLRASDSTSFTEFDTPMFTCRRMEIGELIDQVGLGAGVRAREQAPAVAAPTRAAHA